MNKEVLDNSLLEEFLLLGTSISERKFESSFGKTPFLMILSEVFVIKNQGGNF